MSDAAIAAIVTGLVTITTLVCGFLTLWVKLRYSESKAEEAVARAGIVERKIDNNTLTTEAVNQKADTIVSQTNGAMERMQTLIEQISERLSKLEDYKRESSHRIFDTINTIGLKVERLLVVQEAGKHLSSPQPTVDLPGGSK